MKLNILQPIIYGFITIFFSVTTLIAQQVGYEIHYKNKEYKKSVNAINKLLKEKYLTRVEAIRIPSEFITTKDVQRDVDLRKLFRKRKVKGFYIEENKELAQLHLYAGRCYYKLSEYNKSLNHYIQSLRFRKNNFENRHIIFYEISQIFKKSEKNTAYAHALEAAHMVDPEEYSYSLELGKALYRTPQRKRAIFHLERYIQNTDEDIDPKLYLMAGNLYEDLKKYLKTEYYYKEYLKKNPNDGYIQFALGHIAYKRTGNYNLSIKCLNLSLNLIPKNDIFNRSRAHEYKGDILYHELEFKDAVESYLKTITYQNQVLTDIKNLKSNIDSLNKNISKLKTSLLKEQVFEEYTEYEILLEKKGKKEFMLIQKENQFKKLNAGRIRWNIADAYVRLEKLDDAMKYYREAIKYDYKANKAREKIIKLKLKIKRGY